MKKLLIATIALATVVAVTKARGRRITKGALSAKRINVINSNHENLF